MDRTAYNKCMVPWMRGGGDDRKLRFCIGAKLCSGKSKTEEEAREVCLLPKEPKVAKVKRGKGKSCEESVNGLSQCMTEYLESNKLYGRVFDISTANATLAEALMKCQCG